MATSRIKKETVLKQLKEEIAVQKAVVLFTTLGSEASLNASKNQQLRLEARKAGIVIKIVKNTLTKAVFENLPDISGQTYLAFLEDKENSDEIKVPKSIVELTTTDFKDNFKIVGSVINGEFYDAGKTESLSKVPSFKDSMAMIAGSLNQITAKIAVAVKEIPSGLARGISQIKTN